MLVILGGLGPIECGLVLIVLMFKSVNSLAVSLVLQLWPTECGLVLCTLSVPVRVTERPRDSGKSDFGLVTTTDDILDEW